MTQRVKHLPAMQETRVRSLGQEDPLEKEMATHSGILAWKIPWMEEPGDFAICINDKIGYVRCKCYEEMKTPHSKSVLKRQPLSTEDRRK